MFSGIWCPIPRTLNGSLYPSNGQKYEGTITLICDRGFGINGTYKQDMVLTCESGGKFLPDVKCYSMSSICLLICYQDEI